MIAPQDFLPGLAGWVAQLDDTFPGAYVKPYFAQWEVLHILSLVVLGGASILLNLRLMGFGPSDDSPSEVRRSLAPWLHVGVIGVIASGLLIGASNAERLYTSEAFTAKMLCLAAGLVLTYGVTLPAARADGRLGRSAAVAALSGLAIWAVGIGVFATAKLANPGLWHVLTAAALIVGFVTRGLTRIIYLAGVAAFIVAEVVVNRFVYPVGDYASLDPANKAMFGVFLLWVAGAAAVQIATAAKTASGGPASRALAYASILVWVTCAAAGRWIAFA